MHTKILALLAACGLLLIQAVSAIADAPARSVNTARPQTAAALTDQKMVWGITAANGIQLYVAPGHQYGALHPLDQSAVPDRVNLPLVTIANAKKAGLDGLALDLIGCTGQLASNAAQPLLIAATAQGFLLAPYYEITDKSETPAPSHATLIDRAVAFYTDYWNLVQSKNYTCAARQPDGSLIAFRAHTTALSPAEWQTVTSHLAAQGCRFFWVADMCSNPDLGTIQHFDDPSGTPGLTVPQEIASYFPGSNASMSLFPYAWTSDLNQLASDNSRLFFAPVQPGYDREAPTLQGYTDAQGTAQYRAQWNQAIGLAYAPRWVTLTTWSDVIEHTDIFPDSEWNTTRADLTLWFANRFRGQGRPFSHARLYVTTPQALHPHQASQAEALVLNPTANTLTATVQLYDASGSAVGSPVSAAIAPNSMGAATLPLNFATPSTGTFYRAVATLIGVGGGTLSHVTSAPICLYTTPQTERYSRILYYSIPGYAALPGTPQLAVTGLAAGHGAAGALATVTPPDGTSVRSVEVLLNTWEVQNCFNVLPFAARIPQGTITQFFNQPALATALPGFVVGRVIDTQGRVGYTDPIYVGN